MWVFLATFQSGTRMYLMKSIYEFYEQIFSFSRAPAKYSRVATVKEKYLENELFSRSGKSQGILWMAREI